MSKNYRYQFAAAEFGRMEIEYMGGIEQRLKDELRSMTNDPDEQERIFRAVRPELWRYSSDELRRIIADEPGYIRRVAHRSVIRYRNNPDELAAADDRTEDELRSVAEWRSAIYKVEDG